MCQKRSRKHSNATHKKVGGIRCRGAYIKQTHPKYVTDKRGNHALKSYQAYDNGIKTE